MAALAFAIYAIYAIAQLRAYGWDIERFPGFGDRFTDAATVPAGIDVERDSSGYDGQFFYRLAVEPFSVEPRAAGIRFDYEVYRTQRIAYPLLAFLASGGNPRAALWSLLIVNLGALTLVAACAAVAVDDWRGLAVALHPGFLLTVSRDLAEATEMAFVTAAVLAATRNRKVAAALLLTGAVLAKETAVFAAAGLLAAAVLRRRFERADAAMLLPIAAFLGWKSLLFTLWNLPFDFGTSEKLGIPFAGIAAMFVDAFRAGAPQRVLVLELLLLVAFAVLVLRASRTSTMPPGVKLACLAYATLLFTLGRDFWIEDWAFLRAATGFIVLGLLIAVASPHRRTAMVLAAVSWLALATHVVRWR